MKKYILSALLVVFALADQNSKVQVRDFCEDIDNPEECYALGCDWVVSYEQVGNEFILNEDCIPLDSENDGGWFDECSEFPEDLCLEIDFCVWNDELGQCVRGEDHEDECDPDLICAEVLTCLDGLLYPTACGPENCDEPIEECDGTDWICEDINNLYECFAMGCDWVGGNIPGSGYCADSEDDGGNFEGCVELTQDECTENEFCEWSVVTTPNGVFEICIESNDWNDDGGWDDCDPDLICAEVLTCLDGLLYPTACGPENCDEPIDECNDDSDCNGLGYEDCLYIDYCQWISDSPADPGFGGFCTEFDDNEDDGPPECVLDCEGVENVSPNEDGTYFCEWLLTVFPTGCAEDCEQEILDEIEEFMQICDECLPAENCDDYFGEDDGLDNCSELSLDECTSTPGCYAEFSVNGEYEGCYETDDVQGCWNDQGDYFCIGCEFFISECEYYECTENGFVGPFELDECDDAFGNVTLKVGNAIGLPGELIEVPLFYSSNVNLGGIQFTISDDPNIVQGVEIVSNVGDCFVANSNDVNGSLIGIIFSLEGCELESTPSTGGFNFASVLYEVNSNNFEWGTIVDLYFSEAIISDPQGQGLSVDTIDGSIVFSLIGDASGDGEINVIDVVTLINFILLVDEPNNYQFWSSDINADDDLNVIDVVLLVNLILDSNQ